MAPREGGFGRSRPSPPSETALSPTRRQRLATMYNCGNRTYLSKAVRQPLGDLARDLGAVALADSSERGEHGMLQLVALDDVGQLALLPSATLRLCPAAGHGRTLLREPPGALHRVARVLDFPGGQHQPMRRLNAACPGQSRTFCFTTTPCRWPTCEATVETGCSFVAATRAVITTPNWTLAVFWTT